eukprot:TRINITY_DN14090_c0_g1_i1.p1 TRINITY_DN14090_c0_g1~~TRINITY_DN14090_c0_g1_i1.p1  ORF type:complete len:395 (+),score=49.32 TRINITY_DN14090_c0_g1_i1:180-1364(+)
MGSALRRQKRSRLQAQAVEDDAVRWVLAGLRASGKSTFRNQLVPPDQSHLWKPESKNWLLHNIRAGYLRSALGPILHYFETAKVDGDKVGRRIYKRCQRIEEITEKYQLSYQNDRTDVTPDELVVLQTLCTKVKDSLAALCSGPPQSILREYKDHKAHYAVYWPPAQGEEILEQLDRLPIVFSAEYEPQQSDILTAYSPSYHASENRFKIDDYDVALLDFGSRGAESMKQIYLQGDITLCFFRMDYLVWPEIEEQANLTWQRNDSQILFYEKYFRGSRFELSGVVVFVLTMPDRLQTLIENGYTSNSKHFKDKKIESLQEAVEIIQDMILERVNPILATKEPRFQLSKSDFLVCNCRDITSVQNVAQDCFERYKTTHPPKLESSQASPEAPKTA